MADQLFFSFLKLNISNFCEMISLSCVAFISCKISRNWKMTVDDLQMRIDCHLYFPLFFLLFPFLSVTSHVSIFHIGFWCSASFTSGIWWLAVFSFLGLSVQLLQSLNLSFWFISFWKCCPLLLRPYTDIMFMGCTVAPSV